MLETVLNRIFYSQNKDEAFRDPNKPADSAYFNAQRNIHNKAFIRWCEEAGGERLLQSMEQKLIAQLIDLVIMDVKSVDDMIKMIQLKRDILRDTTFIDRIQMAFAEEEERQKELKGE